MDPGTAGILVAEGAALAAVLAAYSLGREPSAATPDKSAVPPPEAPAAAAPAAAAPGSAAATVTVPDSTEDPTIEADGAVVEAKAAVQAKKDEYNLAKITREKTLNTEMNAEFPPLGRNPDEATATYNERKSRAEKAKELWVAEKRHGFMLEDRRFTAEIATLQKDLDTNRAAAVNAKDNAKATAEEKAKATATTIPTQPLGALPANTLRDNAGAAAAAAPGEGKLGVESPPGLPLPTEIEKKTFRDAVELAMTNKFENLQPAIDLADKTPSLLADTYDGDPFLVYFMKKLIHAAVQNKLRWRVNVITDRAAAKEAAVKKAIASTGRGRIRTPRRIRGGAWTTEVRALILKTLNILKERGEANPKELTPIMTAFLLLVADYGESNLDIYNNLVDIFTTFIDYKGYADRWRTYLLRMNSPDRKLVANVMFGTALEVANVNALNPYFFWARSGLQNSWGDAVAAKPFTIDPAKLTERKKVTAQGPENATTETFNPAAKTVLDKIKNATEGEKTVEKERQAEQAAQGAIRAVNAAWVAADAADEAKKAERMDVVKAALENAVKAKAEAGVEGATKAQIDNLRKIPDVPAGNAGAGDAAGQAAAAAAAAVPGAGVGLLVAAPPPQLTLTDDEKAEIRDVYDALLRAYGSADPGLSAGGIGSWQADTDRKIGDATRNGQPNLAAALTQLAAAGGTEGTPTGKSMIDAFSTVTKQGVNVENPWANIDARNSEAATTSMDAAAAANAARAEAVAEVNRVKADLASAQATAREALAAANAARAEAVALAAVPAAVPSGEAAAQAAAAVPAAAPFRTSVPSLPPLRGSVTPVPLDLFADLDQKADQISDTSPLKAAAKRILARAKSALSNPNPYTKGVLTRALNAAKLKLTGTQPQVRSSARLQDKRNLLESQAQGLSTNLPGAVVDDEESKRRESIASLSGVLVALLEGMKLSEPEGNAFDTTATTTSDNDKKLFEEIYETFTNTTGAAEGEAVSYAPGTPPPRLAPLLGRAMAQGQAVRSTESWLNPPGGNAQDPRNTWAGVYSGGRRRSHRRRHKKRKARTSTFRRNRKH